MENKIKSFKNPAPYKADIEDSQGAMISLIAAPIRKKEMLEISRIQKDDSIDDVERISLLCALIFCQPVETFEDVSQQVLNALVTDFFLEQQNPIKG